MKRRANVRDNLKGTNRGLLLELIATGRCSSRIELSQRTGLTKSAITQIISKLLDEGIIEETNKYSLNDLGRNPMGLDIAEGAPKFAGLYITRTGVRCVICDMKGNILKRVDIQREWTEKQELIDHIYKAMDELLDGAANVAAIGVASVGPVNVKEGIICNPYYFNDISNIPVKALLEGRYQMPVFFEHDVQSAALGEYLFGNSKDFRDILLVGVDIGVGCGIIVNGKRIHAYSGFNPEIGHVSIVYDGIPCACGNKGCMERYVNRRDVTRRLVEATGLDLQFDEFCKIKDNPAVNEILEDMVDRLSSAIVSVLNIVNAQVVLLGGCLIHLHDSYIQRVEKNITEHFFYDGQRPAIVVEKARSMEDLYVIGAAAVAISASFSGII